MKDKTNIINRYKELISLIEKYNHHYYDLDSPVVDDSEYDALMKELVEIEKKNPGIKQDNSPSSKVGGYASQTFSEAPHNPPMLSLGNIFSDGDLAEFDERCRKILKISEEIIYCGELKFDGLAVEAIYEDGKFVKGSTRGNGIVGEDITANLATLKGLPLNLAGKKVIPAYFSVRGEVFMAHSEFERLNKQREASEEPLFANPRNAAAGSLRQLNPEVTAARDLRIFLYSLGSISGMEIKGQKEMFEYLEGLGLPVSGNIVYGNISKMREFYQYWEENRYSLGFDIDGIVVKVSDFRSREQLGSTSKNPRWAAAWKFPAKEAVTVVDSVDYQVGRTGVITPVANLRPINIGGVLVKRATLHNFQEIGRLGLKTGDSVKVKRAGDVIPKVVDVIQDKRPAGAVEIIRPEKCPSCGHRLVEEDILIRCVNSKCPAIKFETLKFFVSKDAMDIESFGPELIVRLYNAGILKKISDVFKLTKDDLLNMERMGQKLADKILAAINKKRNIPLSVFLRSLGIRNVGDHTARVIAGNVKSLERLYKTGVEELTAIKEIGPETADSVYEFFHEPDSTALVREILSSGVRVLEEESIDSSIESIKDKTFVFTGTMHKLGRKEAEELIERFGGKASSSVSKKTDYVVAGESPGSKRDKAVELGVKILSEDDFLLLVDNINEK